MPSEMFEDKLRAKLGEARVLPSAEVWQAIEGQLAPPRRKRPLFWWWIGGTGLLAALLMGTWVFWPANSPTGELVAAAPAQDMIPAHTEQVVSTEQAMSTDQQESEAKVASPASSPIIVAKSAHRSAADANLITGTSTQVHQPAPLTPTPPEPSSLAGSTSTAQPSTESLGDGATGLMVQGIAGPEAELSAPFSMPTVDADALSPFYARRWSLRLSVQSELAGRGPLSHLLRAPGIDHSVLETDPLLIRPNEGQVYTLSYPRQSVTMAVGIGLQITPRWELISGASLMVSEAGQLQRGTADLAPVTPGPIRAEEAVSSYDLLMTWRQRQIEIPLALQHQFVRRGRHRLSFLLGVSADRAWRTPIQSYDLDDSRGLPSSEPDPLYEADNRSFTTPDAQELLRFRSWHAHLDARLWYGFQFAPSLQLYMGPSMKYHLRGAYAGLAARDQMRYRVGWEVGIRFGE